MVDTVTFADIADGVSTGVSAAELINDTKRAVNETIVEVGDQGPVVLKDWAEVSSLNYDLLSNVTLDGLSPVTIQLRGMYYTGADSGTLSDNLRLSSPTTYIYSESVRGTARIERQVLSSDRGLLYGGTRGIRLGTYDIAIRSDLASKALSLVVDGQYMPISLAGHEGAGTLHAVMAFIDDSAIPTQLYMQGKAGETLSYSYRVIKS